MHMNRQLRFLFVVLVLLGAVTSALAQAYKGVKIAFVPVFNQSGEKWVELQARQVEAGNKWLVEEFSKRGFTVVPADEVAKAISELKIDFGDEEQRTRENFYKIGQKTGATLVAFPVIVASKQGKTGGLFPKAQGEVTMKLWLMDAVKKEPIIYAVTMKGKASGSSFLAGLEKGSDLQVKAVGNGLKDQLKKFLGDYPVIGG
jgi:hypothetical protein